MQTAASWGDFCTQVANTFQGAMDTWIASGATLPLDITWGIFTDNGQTLLIGNANTGTTFSAGLGGIVNDLMSGAFSPAATAANSSGWNTVTPLNTENGVDATGFDDWEHTWQNGVVGLKRFLITSILGGSIVVDSPFALNVSGVYERQTVNVIVWQTALNQYVSVDRMNLTNGGQLTDITGPYNIVQIANNATAAVQNEALVTGSTPSAAAGAIVAAINGLDLSLSTNHGANVASMRSGTLTGS